MTWLWLVGRVVFGVYFILDGILHFTRFESTKQYAAYKGIPVPGFSVAVTGLLLLAGGLSILTGYWVQTALILLAIFLVAAAVLVHNFWTVEDAQGKATEMAHFTKNIALASAALMMLAISQWSWTV
ncbi:MAG: DoxX family protein [Kyrpidia tusciae]|nr:DoxX family protein [Kyrpidia tusciae]MBE3552312.1 DoxX family protein [Kyrpidia tusciae]